MVGQEGEEGGEGEEGQGRGREKFGGVYMCERVCERRKDVGSWACIGKRRVIMGKVLGSFLVFFAEMMVKER